MQLTHQPGILAPVPEQAIYLCLSRRPGIKRAQASSAVRKLLSTIDTRHHVFGLSAALCKSLGLSIDGMRNFPQFREALVELPVTQSDIWIWLRGQDRGELFQQARAIEHSVTATFEIDSLVNAFRYQKGRDLTGFEDGTENPKAKAARRVALVNQGNCQHSSFVAVQSWQHHLARFDAMTTRQKNNAVGRDLKSNQELPDAPAFAHVKRTAQESFSPEAFVLRRSMPWTESFDAGLMFVAFGNSFDAFEAQLQRMSGAQDGIIDGLFEFSRPVSGAYYWCPALVKGEHHETFHLPAIG